MSKWIVVIWISVTICVGARTRTKEEYAAMTHGAESKTILKVVNDQGVAVTNAAVLGNFHMADDKGNPFHGHTDDCGIYVAVGKCIGDWHFFVKKNGHYESFRDMSYLRLTNTLVVNGRWQPYGATNTVVLKRKVNPVAMYVKPDRDGILPPVKNKFIGFDLEMGACVQPYGPGANADILLKYEYEAGKIPLLHYRGAAFFSFTNQFDGAYIKKKDKFSNFMSVYEADTNATYQQNFAFVYDRLTETIVENSKFSEAEYLVLRVRSKVDANGRLLAAHYAKIYGPIAAGGGGIYFSFYFNPNANDPNLEADTTRNLLNPHDLGFPP